MDNATLANTTIGHGDGLASTNTDGPLSELVGNALIAYAVLINVVTAIFMIVDKRRAIHQEWRVPEHILCFLAFLGGWLGGFAGMIVVCHKVSKCSFLAKFTVVSVANVVLILRLTGAIDLSYPWVCSIVGIMGMLYLWICECNRRSRH